MEVENIWPGFLNVVFLWNIKMQIIRITGQIAKLLIHKNGYALGKFKSKV